MAHMVVIFLFVILLLYHDFPIQQGDSGNISNVYLLVPYESYFRTDSLKGEWKEREKKQKLYFSPRLRGSCMDSKSKKYLDTFGNAQKGPHQESLSECVRLVDLVDDFRVEQEDCHVRNQLDDDEL